MTYIDIILTQNLIGIVIKRIMAKGLQVNLQNSCYQKQLIYIHTIEGNALFG